MAKSATGHTSPASARAGLIPHHSVVAQHLCDRRPLWQQSEFLGRPRLELPAVFDDRRARREPSVLRTHRHAAGHRDRCDREGGDPEKNDFALAEEVTLKGGHQRRPDIVLYLNGLAIAVIELKRSSVEVKPFVRLDHRRITLTVRPGSTPEKREEIMEEWHRGLLHEAVPPLIRKWETKLGVEVSGYFLQRMKTKWGSCNSRHRNIRLNTELVKKPRDLLERITYRIFRTFAARGGSFQDI